MIRVSPIGLAGSGLRAYWPDARAVNTATLAGVRGMVGRSYEHSVASSSRRFGMGRRPRELAARVQGVRVAVAEKCLMIAGWELGKWYLPLREMYE